jgi:lysophospholipase L1-like esterase
MGLNKPRGSAPAGKSAYDLWIEIGNVGTVQDFLDSLIGPAGPSGGTGGGVSKWNGKIWSAVGDSITAGGSSTTKIYHEYVKERLGFSTVNNNGVSSTKIATSNVSSMNNRIKSVASGSNLITVFGGTNDWGFGTGFNAPLGAITDTTVATIYGALHSICQTMYTTYPNATCAFFTPLPRGDAQYPASSGVITIGKGANDLGYTLEQVADAILEVGEYYSVPVLDLYRCSGLFPAIAEKMISFLESI